MVGFAMTEENLRLFYSHSLGMPASDGSVYSPQGQLSNSMPHPRSYGSFPRFLGTYVREQKVVDMQTAIYKMCALPASRLGIKDRGLLIPGYRADVVVFDPATICELSTYAQPHQFNKGIEHVFVNGEWTIKNEQHTGALAGSVIRLG
jgi:N-acyl-D-amino-acid deacylase